MALDAGVGRYRGFALLAIAMTGMPPQFYVSMSLTYRINRINRCNPRQQTINLPTYDPPPEINITKRLDRTSIHDYALGTFISDNGMFLCVRLLGWVD
jgi:hypothetical protein